MTENTKEPSEGYVCIKQVDKEDFDTLIVSHLGGFGRYQRLLYIALSFVGFAVSFHNLVHVFTGAVPRHRCLDVETITGITFSMDDTDYSIPKDELNGTYEFQANSSRLSLFGEDGKPSCLLNVTENMTIVAEKRAANLKTLRGKSHCTSWEFSHDQYESTIVTQWNLVCDKRWLAPLSQSLHMVGCLIGAVVFGELSDRFGRRIILLVTSFIVVIIGIVTAFAPWYELYATLRLLLGAALAGEFNCAYVIALELVPPKWRILTSVSILYFNALGMMIMAGIAYAIRDWRTLQLVLSASLSIMLAYVFICPESPRWLLSNNRENEAKKLVSKIARFNRKKLPDNWHILLDSMSQEKPTRKHSVLDLIRHRHLRRTTFYLCVMWFSNSVTYFGLSLYAAKLGENDYMNFFLLGLVEIPAYTFCLWSLNAVGRKTSVAGSLLLCGVVLLCTAPIDKNLSTVSIILALIGKLAISVSYACAYPFTAELYPTVLRNSGLGVTSMWARVGGLIAPFITLLVLLIQLAIPSLLIILLLFTIVSGDVWPALPLLTFGACALLGGLLCLFLPETNGRKLPETIEDSAEIHTRICPC